MVSGLAIWMLKGAWIYVADDIPVLMKTLVQLRHPGLTVGSSSLLIAYVIGDLLMRTSKLGPTLRAVGVTAGLRRL